MMELYGLSERSQCADTCDPPSLVVSDVPVGPVELVDSNDPNIIIVRSVLPNGAIFTLTMDFKVYRYIPLPHPSTIFSLLTQALLITEVVLSGHFY